MGGMNPQMMQQLAGGGGGGGGGQQMGGMSTGGPVMPRDGLPDRYPGPEGPGGGGGGDDPGRAPGGGGGTFGGPDPDEDSWFNAPGPGDTWFRPDVDIESPFASGTPPGYNPNNFGVQGYTQWNPGYSPGGNQGPLPPWLGGKAGGGGPGGGGNPYAGPPGGGGPMMFKGGPPGGIGPIGGGGGGDQQPNVQPPTSIYDTYASGKQMMDETLDQAIGGAVASAGFGGNRYGSAAANATGRVGADAAAQLNNQFTNMLYNQGQSDLNRQLQATGMGLQNQQFMEQLKSGNLNQAQDRLLRGATIGQQQGQMNESNIAARLQALLGAGQGETQRQDQWDMAAFQDYANNMWGSLDHLAPFVGGVPMARSEPIVSQSGGKPGAVDYISAIAPIIAAMYCDERLKDNIQDTGLELAPGLNVKTWDWSHSGKPGVGVTAQDVERVFPDAVFEVPIGTKVIDTVKLMAGLQIGA